MNYDSLKNKIVQTRNKLGELILPLEKDSKFYDNGTLTIEDFIKSGDKLVSKSKGHWLWASNSNILNDKLPRNKQYLVSKTNISIQRFSENMNEIQEISEPKNELLEDIEEVEEDWVIEEESIDYSLINNTFKNNLNTIKEGTIIVEEPNIFPRYYDLYITYDFYYRVPHLWMSGFDNTNIPLSFDDIKEDIATDYMNKTVTFENFPFLDEYKVSIHPCKHSNVMKLFLNCGEINKVEDYLFVFLKFVNSIIPSIQFYSR